MATTTCRPACGPNPGTAMAQPMCGCPVAAAPPAPEPEA